jgi:hypothetical protein
MNATLISRGAGLVGIAVVALLGAIVVLVLSRSPLGVQPAPGGLGDKGMQLGAPTFAIPTATDAVVEVAQPSVAPTTTVEPVATQINGQVVSGALTVDLPGFDPGEPIDHPQSSPCDPETQECG